MIEETEPTSTEFIDIFIEEIIYSILPDGFMGVKENKFGLKPFKDSIKPNTPRFLLTPILPELHEFARPLRQCVEVIDGEEYYNVGKLRKVFENIPEEMRLDYRYYLAPSASGAAWEAEPTPPPYAELTIGSRGQAVLDMKQRFYELGYFNTTSFNDRFTDKTAETVKLFEKNNGLPVDGVADPVMLGVLFSDRAVGK